MSDIQDAKGAGLPRNGRTPGSFPAFQLYPADFLSSPKVRRMTTQEVGAYWLLLCTEWLDGPLENDPQALASLARLSRDEFASAWRIVGTCFKLDSHGHLYNERLERERSLKAKLRRTRASLGAKGGKERAKRQAIATSPPSNSQDFAQANPSPSALCPLPSALRPQPSGLFPPSAASPEATDKPKPRKRKPKADDAPPHPDHQPLIRYWTDAYAKAYGTKYPFDSRDAAHVHRLLKLASAQEIREAFDAALADPWWHDHGLTLKALLDQFGRFRALATKPQRQGETTAVRRMRAQLEEAQEGQALDPGFNPLEGLTAAGQKRLTQ